VATSIAASQFTLASDYKTSSFALLENLVGAEVDAQLQHRTTVSHPVGLRGRVARYPNRCLARRTSKPIPCVRLEARQEAVSTIAVIAPDR
jgi:hypothetical protein